MRISLLAVSVILLLSSAALGGPSGLILIPTTEILPCGCTNISLERYSPRGDMLGSEVSKCFQLGIGHNIEMGYDRVPDGASAFNIKWLLCESPSERAIAVGVQNIHSGLKAEPYMVGSAPLGIGSIHLGANYADSKLSPFFGYDLEITPRTTFAIDYTGGDDNFGSVGISYDLGRGFSATAAFLRHNSDSDLSGIHMLIEYTFKAFGK